MINFFKKKGYLTLFVSALVLIIAFYFGGVNFLRLNTGAEQQVRTVVLQDKAVDYQSFFDGFDEDSYAVLDGNSIEFFGKQTIDASVFDYIDNVSYEDKQAAETSVEYDIYYDADRNVMFLSAELTDLDGVKVFDDVAGVPFISDDGEIDIAFSLDGNVIFLSDLEAAGVVNNCGWLSTLLKVAIAVAVVAVLVAVIVVAAPAAVAAISAAGPILAAGAVTTTVVTATGAAVATTTVAATVVGAAVAGATAAAGAAAAAVASTAFAVALTTAAVATAAAVALSVAATAEYGEEVMERPIGGDWTEVISRASGALLALIYNGIKYATIVLTAEIAKELAKEAYFLAFANPNDGKMYFCFAPITKPLSIEIMQFNHSEISVYTYHDYNARSIAQQAGQNFSPIHDFATKSGYFNHYHMGDRPHEVSYSHAFYGLPIFF